MSVPLQRDTGPPTDPDSPFAEERALVSRRDSVRPPTRRVRLAAIRAWLVVLGMIALAVFAGMRLTEDRIAGQAQVPLGTATLLATTTSAVAPARSEVVDLLVEPSEAVERGAPIARLRVFDAGPHGPGSTTVLRSPLEGITTAVLARAGGALERGSPVVEIFDPRSARFELEVEPDALAELANGMRVKLTSPAAPAPVEAIVSDVRPPRSLQSVGETEEAPRPILVLTPADTTDIRALLPGLRFDATVDTGSVPEERPEIIRFERE